MVDITRDGVISLTRGDTARFPLFINSGSNLKPIRYVLKDEDEVYLAIMEPNQCFENAIVKQKYTNMNLNSHKDILIEIGHNDTKCLTPGTYFYQIKAKLLVDMKTIYTDMHIKDTSSILKKDTKLMKGSILNGKEVVPNSDDIFYVLLEDVICNEGDIIKAESELKALSIINGNHIDTHYDVNTIIDKTKLNLME